MRFLIVGGLAFLIDVGLTQLLILAKLDAWLARIPAIAAAMAFAWLANRYFTYEVKAKKSANEATRYFMVASAMALMNYLIYVVLIGRGTVPVVAVTVATACQTVLSFYCYRLFVFREPE